MHLKSENIGKEAVISLRDVYLEYPYSLQILLKDSLNNLYEEKNNIEIVLLNK